MITIRKAITQDIMQLELLFQFTRVYTFASRSKNDFQIGDYAKSVQEDEVWIAEESGIILGFVSVYLADNFIHNLFVHPHFQRNGIGKMLLSRAENILDKPLSLKIALDNSNVCKFYEKHGWYMSAICKDAPEPYISYVKD